MTPAITQTGNALGIVLEETPEGRTLLASRRVADAVRFAESLYAGRSHWSGIPLLQHVAAVLRIFLSLRPDEDAVIACLLRHAFEDGALKPKDLETRFGSRVRALVSSLHLLSHVSIKNRRTSVDNLRLMFLRVSEDPRPVFIILCDRCVVLGRSGGMATEQRRRLCQETLDLFAPVAARLGIYTLKNRLEESAFPVVYPTDAARIAEQLDQLHVEHGDFLDDAAARLKTFLKTSGVQARVEGREKQMYSIFGKMTQKSITHVRDLYDLFALRVIVGSDAECYQTLGLLHRIGHPLPNRFKDYIAFPKPNGYQSLHTTLARMPGVPAGLLVEVQIRTETMHRKAEFGLAAHWSYKEGRKPHGAAATRLPLVDHIFVLTPKGDIVELPEGANPLDFAFAVHTELGLAFKAARINGSIAPLDAHLENGDVVEILRHGDPRPSPQWMQVLRTAPARARLKRYLASRAQQSDVAVKPKEEPRARAKAKAAVGRAAPARVEIVESDIRMPVRYARCCKPDEGGRGAIAGIVSRTGHIRIHRVECRMTKAVNPERRVKVRWTTQERGGR